MTQDKAEVFIKWLDGALAENNLTDNQLAKRAKISHSNFSKARNDGILPKWEACEKIAHALRIDPVEVFRAAGLIPYPAEFDQDFERLRFTYGKLSHHDRKIAVKLVGVLVENEE
jgi:transcriptional regulator with XRE-family HTH domain